MTWLDVRDVVIPAMLGALFGALWMAWILGLAGVMGVFRD